MATFQDLLPEPQDRRRAVISVRCSTGRKKAILARAEHYGVTISEYILTACKFEMMSLDDPAAEPPPGSPPKVAARSPRAAAGPGQSPPEKHKSGGFTPTERLSRKKLYLDALNQDSARRVSRAAMAAGVASKAIQGWRRSDKKFAAAEKAIRQGG